MAPSSPIAPDATTIRCKICNAEATYRFSAPLAHGLTGRYYECTACGFLHSQHLDEPSATALVYERARADDDPGAAFRLWCVASRLAALARLRAFGTRPIRALDFGTGSGFLPAFLTFRPGWHVVGFDAFATAAFSPSLVLRDWKAVASEPPFQVVTAIEVLEHFTRPREQLEAIASVMDPQRSFLYVTTERFSPPVHGASWPYLAPHTAQHCSFYSRGSLELVREIIGASHLFPVAADNEWLFVRGDVSVAHIRAALAWTRLMIRMTVSPKFGLPPSR